MAINQITSTIINYVRAIPEKAEYCGLATALFSVLAFSNAISGSYVSMPETATAIGLWHETRKSFYRNESDNKGHIVAALGLGTSLTINFAGDNSNIGIAEASIAGFYVFGQLVDFDLDTVKSKDRIKFHYLGRSDLAEDIFIKESDKALADVRKHGMSANIYEAMLYAENEVVDDTVREYLKEEVTNFHNSYQKSSAEVNLFQSRLERFYMREEGLVAKSLRLEASSQREKANKNIIFRDNAVFLLRTLDEEGLEGYVRELSKLYPERNTYFSSEFNSLSTDN